MNLTAVSLDTWYHVGLTYHLGASSDTVDVALTPYGGSTLTFNNTPFRTQVGAVDNISFLNNGVASLTGSWAVDNVIPEPSTWLLVAFGIAGVAAFRRRRSA